MARNESAFTTGYAEAAVHRAEFGPPGAQPEPFELDAPAKTVAALLEPN